MSYPSLKDVQEHKDHLWSALLQYFSGLVPIQTVEDNFKALMGDAGLWVVTNGSTDNKVTIAELKQIISTLKLSIDKE